MRYNRKYDVLVIIPAYNEAKSVGVVIDSIRKHLQDIDILVVNDGSMDQTGITAANHGVHVLDLPFNLGIGGAMQTGFKYAVERGYQYAVQVDADGQHPVGDVRQLLKAVENNTCDLAIGSRYIEGPEQDDLRSRALAKAILGKAIKIFTGMNITDCTSGLRAMNRELFSRFADYYPVDYPEAETIVILNRTGFRIREFPVKMNHRLHGSSSISYIQGIYYVCNVILAIFIDMFRLRRIKGKIGKS